VKKSAGTGTRAHRRAGQRLALALAVPLCLCASVPASVRAQQVGNEPERSPYADILTHQGWTLFAGRFAGNAGAAGVGARPGLILGTRLQIRFSSAIDMWVTMGEVWTSRLRINAPAGDSTRIAGNLTVRLVAADLALALNLTGDKTWHGFAPYVALGAGITTPSAKVVDPGGYELGTDFTLVPTVGTRFFIAHDLALRFEARDYYYRYTYPLAYYVNPFTGHADHTPVLPYSVADRQWYNNFTFWAGVTYGFNF
jgi:hypothetical protein